MNIKLNKETITALEAEFFRLNPLQEARWAAYQLYYEGKNAEIGGHVVNTRTNQTIAELFQSEWTIVYNETKALVLLLGYEPKNPVISTPCPKIEDFNAL